jgi:hypothetical protein
MKKTCAGIGASLLFLAIAVLTVTTVAAVESRGSSRRFWPREEAFRCKRR